MSIASILARLAELGIAIRVSEGTLSFHPANADAAPPESLAALETALLTRLSAHPAQHQLAREAMPEMSARWRAQLDASGSRVENLKANQPDFDLSSDDWAVLDRPEIDHVRRQVAQLPVPAKDCDLLAKDLFGLPHVLTVPSGRVAKSCLMACLPTDKPLVPQNQLSTNWLFHQMHHGFQPLELACAARTTANDVFLGELDLAALDECLAKQAASVSLVVVELANSATGAVVSLAHLRQLRARLAPLDIPLLLDITGVLDCAVQIQAHEPGCQDRDTFDLVRELCDLADIALMTLSRAMPLDEGCLVALRSKRLYEHLARAGRAVGPLGTLNRRRLAQVLASRDFWLELVRSRAEAVAALRDQLHRAHLMPATHGASFNLIVDPGPCPANPHIHQQLLASLYAMTGIRARSHTSGLEHTHQVLLRLDVPLGFNRQQALTVAQRLAYWLRAERFLSHPPRSNGAPSADAADSGEPSHCAAQRADAVAVIGYALTLPQQVDAESFFAGLAAGEIWTRRVPAERWPQPDFHFAAEGAHWAFHFDDPFRFDHAFFGMSAEDAQWLDPQHRITTETVWHSFEHAGYVPVELEGSRTGVFMGVVQSDFKDLIIAAGLDAGRHGGIGFAAGMLANRISHQFDLRGPSESINAACASSALAVTRALEALADGSCTLALAGGVNLILAPTNQDAISRAVQLAADGRCRPFDAAASGYVRGEGCAVLLLKPLSDAERDRDEIHAVILGGAANHNGRTPSISTPRPSAQAQVIAQAFARTGVDPASVSYVELAANGQEFGDLLEVEGLCEGFAAAFAARAQQLPAKLDCRLGNLKGSTGHLETASGGVALVKLLLALNRGVLPGNPGLCDLHPNLFADELPFRFLRETEAWAPAKDPYGVPLPRRAGLTSLGFAGVNVHLLLEQYLERRPEPLQRFEVDLFTLSAQTPERLRAYAEHIANYLETPSRALDLARLCHSARVGRLPLAHRLAVQTDDVTSLAAALRAFLADQDFPGLWTAANAGPLDEAGLTAAWATPDLGLLARHWVRGAQLDWRRLDGELPPLRLGFPGYPFAPISLNPFKAAVPAPARAETGAAATPPVGSWSPATTAVPRVAPRDAIEQQLAQLWRTLLKHEDFGINDDFFALGGQSLMATQVTARLADLFGPRLPLRTLFEAPTIARLAEAVRAAGGTPRGLGEAPQPDPEPPFLITPSADGRYPLSLSQERIWFITQLSETGSAYHIHVTIDLVGPLSAPALSDALAALVARQALLRTRIDVHEGRPYQHIGPSPAFDLSPVVASGATPEQRRQNALLACQALVDEPFAAGAPLLRLTLFQLGPDAHLLLIVMHHLIGDGWSINLFFQELASLYETIVQQRPSTLAPLPVQYYEFAQSQRQWLENGIYEDQVTWWRDQLDGLPPLLELPTDYPRPAHLSYAGAVTRFSLEASRLSAWKTLAQSEHATLFMLLLSAFQVVLGRYADQTDFAVGAPIANRTRQELENLIGLFMNAVVLRARLHPALSFRALLARNRETTLGAYAHQDLPFERLAELLHPERSQSHAVWFQVVLNLLTVPNNQLQAADLTMTLDALDSRAATLDLSIYAYEEQGTLAGWVEYNTDLFAESSVQALLAQLFHLLDAAVADPDQSLVNLPLLAEAERRQVLEHWGRNPQVMDDARLFVQRFAARCQLSPAAPALHHDEGMITYAELGAAVNRLARWLRARGLRSGEPVALRAGRVPEGIVGLLAIIAAGGIWQPLDPNYPEDRLRFMVEDASARLVLDDEQLPPWTAPPAGIVGLRAALAEAKDFESTPLDLPIHPLDGAYLIYTSGSTGTPKGVVVGHAALLNYLLICIQNYRLGPDDRVLQFSSIGFDIAVEELFPTLACGASLVLHDQRHGLAAAEMVALIETRRLTWLTLPTAWWHEFTLALHLQNLRLPTCLRLLIVGGEATKPEILARWLELAPQVTWFNTYGPTETTVAATAFQIGPGHAPSAAVLAQPPIGLPLPNTSAQVLDGRLQPVPVGVRGELFIGGAGVARGYLGRPALTAERFLPDPFAAEPGARLYRSGDLVHFQRQGPARGQLVFSGRRDQQLKIRGFRVEPGEIESVLQRHAEVVNATVAVVADPKGQKRLVAYVCGPGPEREDALSAFLAGQLPQYLVPSAFVFMAALPLTANGKLDHRRLPAPNWRQGDQAHEDPPRGPVENALAAMFADLLGCAAVGRHQNFFELGGHSLLATRLVATIQRELGIGLALKTIFDAPTLATLAQHCELGEQPPRPSPQPAPARPSLPPLSRAWREGVPLPFQAPLSFTQQRLLFIDRYEGPSAAYTLPFAYTVKGALALVALERALNRLAARHESLRTSILSEETERQCIAPKVELALALVDLSALENTQALAAADALAEREAGRPFLLERGPLLRALLVRMAADTHRLVLCLHHIVGDGWSMEIFAREWGAFYRAALLGDDPGLESLPFQYADFAHWQRAVYDDARLAPRLDWWRAQLRDTPTAIDLPHDTQAGPRTRRGDHFDFTFEADDAAPLYRRHQVTPFLFHLAVYGVLLARHAGQDVVNIGIPVANRTHPDLAPIIGFFANTLVLTVRLEPGLRFDQLLERLRQQSLAAFEQADTPFEKVVEAVQPERDLERTPLFQVMYSYLERGAPAPSSFPGMAFTQTTNLDHSAKFELVLEIGRSEPGQLPGTARYRASLQYDRDLFLPASVARLGARLEYLTQLFRDQPGRCVLAVDPMPADERQLLITSWNQTARPYPDQLTVSQVFELQVDAQGDAPALLWGDRVIDYQTLDQRANQLAHRLRAAGLNPGELAALCLPRSPQAVIAMLAILKAGGGYVPIDAAYPAERIAYMLHNCRAHLLLAKRDALPVPADLRVIDPEDGASARFPNTRLVFAHDPLHLAQVMYTSGSTGEPKGVALGHRGIVRLVRNNGLSTYAPGQVGMLQSSLSFDAATYELWGALLNGAALAILPDKALDRLPDFIRRHHVGLGLMTTQLFNLVVDDQPDCFAAMDQLVVGGEAMSPRHARIFMELHPHVGLINAYGPTENTCITTVAELGRLGYRQGPVPLGGPLANTQVYLVDRRLRPVPLGVYGELLTGGDGLAQGYLRRPALTAERFVPDPFATEPGSRLYRTGDLVRWTQLDGQPSLEFKGRIDRQVKLRGFRIELREIESALIALPGVTQALVQLRDSASGKQLVAYLARPAQAEPGLAQLRQQLAERLPAFMMPSAFVVLEAFPVTDNGKIDSRRLPEPELGQAAQSTHQSDPIAELIAGIWAQLLGVDVHDPHANFFELGGHSLLATRLAANLSRAFGREVGLRAIFERPTVSGLAELVRALEGVPSLPEPDTSWREHAAWPIEAPLSFTQSRLFFIDRYEGSSALYNIPFAAWLSGPLDTAALEAALATLVARHEILRTCFLDRDGEPTQRITDVPAPPLRLLDLSAEADAENRALAAVAADDSAFDLERAPLLRYLLVRVTPLRHLLHLDVHHIAFDGWSTAVLIAELRAAYDALLRQRQLDLPAPALQYADFTLWQRGWLRDELLASQRAFWLEYLADAPLVLELPLRQARPLRQTYRGAVCSFAIPAAASTALRQLARATQATPFIVLAAAFGELLGRYAGAQDVLFGTPVANRRHATLAAMIGFFANTLVLRAERRAQSVRARLAAFRERVLAALAHQDLPFEQLVEALNPTRDLARTPVFQTVFSYLEDEPELRTLPGLAVEPVMPAAAVAKFELTLTVVASEQLECRLEYNADLFAPEFAQQFAQHYVRLLAAWTADPEARCDQLSVLDEHERAQLLVHWNHTVSGPPLGEHIVEAFARVVGTAPERIALSCGPQRLSYRELDRLANHLAQRLAALGCRPESMVAVAVTRGPGLIVALLGILKAGGAYVPIDTSFPAERIGFMLADTGCALAVADRDHAARLPLPLRAQLVDLEPLLTAIGDEACPMPVLHGANLAYLNYTSGTTGRPKAVQICHASVLHFVRDLTYIQPHPQMVMAQISNPAFDALTFEVWTALLYGARLAIVPRETLLDLDAFAKALASEQIDTMFLTVAFFNECIAVDPNFFAAQANVLFGGERASVAPIRAALNARPPGALYNLYGPTECTTLSLWYRIDHLEPEVDNIPIGRNIAATTTYVLDPANNLLPCWAPGELLIGGDRLSRGYLGRPGLTAEKFVPNPFATKGEHSRLYRSGDLVRRRPDGLVEFLGRIGSQVKIRGFRIEPQEIEAVLAQLPWVEAAVVLVSQQAHGKELEAAVSFAQHTPPPPAWLAEPKTELRAYLASKLPDYMIPATTVVLERLPLNANGKLDRRAIAALVAENRAQETPTALEPVTPTEQALAELFAAVLGQPLERIGRNANFFELGGHSLAAVRLTALARQRLGLELPLAEIFATADLASLAQRLDRGKLGTLQPPSPRHLPVGTPIPLSWPQQRLYFIERLEGPSTTYTIPVAFALEGLNATLALEAACDQIRKRHESLRTRFGEHQGEACQWVLPFAPTALEVADLSGLGEQAQSAAQALARAEAARPFELASGRLLRVRLLRLASDRHLLLILQHHIASDGWSLGLLLDELARFYAAACAQPVEPPAPVPLQYPDFALWQRGPAQAEALLDQARYWRERLADAPAALELPLRAARPAYQTAHGAVVELHLDADLSARLRDLAQRADATLFMILEAAFAELLARHGATADLCIGTPVANRRFAELEPLIGFFVNTLVLRHRLDRRASVLEALAEARATAIAAFSHQDLPFEQVVESVNPSRDPSRSPIFQVLFSLQAGDQLPRLELAGTRAELQRIDAPSAKFDLSLGFADMGGELRGELIYNSDLFDPAYAATLGRHYARLLAGFVAWPERAICRLPVLDEGERARLLDQLAPGAALEGEAPTLEEGFRAQARRTPQALALVCGGHSWTYAALDRQVACFAQALRAKGAGREHRVAVLLDREGELIPCLLAILRCGAAYVPLDTAYPVERLQFMLADSGAGWLITRPETLARVGLLTDLPVLDPKTWADAEPGDSDWPPVLPEQLAYLIYTSGSTGRPKAVAIAHRSAAALLTWARAHYTPADLAAVLAGTSICFDLSIFEIYLPLSCGGCVYLEANALALATMAERERITLLNTVPSVAAELLRLGPLPAALRTVNLAGEPLTAALVDELYRQPQVARVFDLYGPSEDTTYSTFALRRAASKATIGRPLAGTRAYLLDPTLELVPPGVAGELALAGIGLARGYLARPALTAAKFVPDPFAVEAGARLYRTGDLARFAPSGELLLVGRIDHQVKLRGFRIELGEIEAVLARHPMVHEVAVLVTPQAGGQLCAFLAATNTPPKAELEALVAAHLPAYMVPSRFLFIERLPLTANRKTDRAALLRLAGEAARDQAVAAPTSEAERQLCELFAEILERDPESIDIHASFFDLGGHSLAATRLTALVRQRIGAELSLRQIFATPSAAGLAHHLKDCHQDVSAGPVPLPGDEPRPLSFPQQRLHFLYRLEGASPEYNMPIAMRLRGPISASILATVFAALAERHPSLRTQFREQRGTVLQSFSAPPPALPCVDLSGLDPELAQTLAQSLLARAARHRFQLEHGPLLRLLLIRLANQESLFLVNQHHIISDGWSMRLLLEDFVAHYRFHCGRANRPAALPPLRYADYAVWQQQFLRGARLRDQLDFWAQQLQDCPNALPLPYRGTRPAQRHARGAVLRYELEPALVLRVHDLARNADATPFMVYEAAFADLLARFAGVDDLCIGVPVANRRFAELEQIVGFFVNSLVLRHRLDRAASLQARLAQTRELILGALAHQDVPFEKVVERVNPVRDTSRTPLFQVLFSYADTQPGLPALPGLHCAIEPLETVIAKFDLSLDVVEGTAPHFNIEYDLDLFEAGTIAQLAQYFTSILEAWTAQDPQLPCHALQIHPESCRRTLLHLWNQTSSASEPGETLPTAFAACVARHPQALALVDGAVRVTYAELAAQATTLAGQLRARGCGAETLVAFALERGHRQIVALLAILQAGGAYVPLDPSYPKERLAFMLADSACTLVITETALLQTLPELQSAERLILDQVPESAPSSIAPVALDSANLAYLNYTSGTTGLPKAVQISHANILRLVRDHGYVDVPEGAVFGQISNAAFDALTFEVWTALLRGGQLDIVPREVLLDLPAFANHIVSHGIQIMFLTVALFYECVAADPQMFQSMTQVLFGGDRASAAQLRRVLALPHPPRLINGYGPTETTTFAATYRVTALPEEWDSAPIGRPIAATSLYVLDRDGQLAPLGAPGELHIGGAGLARGYLGRPAMTAARFVPNPFPLPGTDTAEPGARLYRSGDLVRWNDQGQLLFLGRIDTQVKIRGYRIEPMEVEAVLLEHPLVQTAAVLTRDTLSGKELAAAVVLSQAADNADTVASLRAYLAARVPAYMLPSRVALLERMPLTPNGKLDRPALLRLINDEGHRGQALTPPHGPRETLMAALWAELLELRPDQLGRESDFFQLGGHSLNAVRLVSLLSSRFGAELTLRDFFANSTLAESAALLADSKTLNDQKPNVDARTLLVPLQAKGASTPRFWVHPIGGSVAAYLGLAGALGDAAPFLGIQSPALEGQPIPASINELARHYLDAVRLRQPQGPYRLGGWSLGGLIALEMAIQLQDQGETVSELVLLDSFLLADERFAYSEQELFASFAVDWLRIAGVDPATLDARIANLDPEREPLAQFVAIAHAHGWLPAELNEPYLRPHWAIYHAHYTAARTYRPAPYAGAVRLIEARDNASGDHGLAPLLANLTTQTLPGDHYSILAPEHLPALSQAINRSGAG